MTHITQFPPHETLSFCELSRRWLQWKSVRVRESTLAIYRCYINSHLLPLLQEISLRELDEEQLNQMCFHGFCRNTDPAKELSPKSRIDLIRTLNNILQFGFENGYIPQRLKAEHPRPSGQKLNVMREEEQCRLEQILHRDITKNEAIGIYLCLYTGIRVGELCGLQWDDIDLDYGVIQIRRTVQRVSSPKESPKTYILIGPPKSCHSEREIPVPDHLIGLLKQVKSEPSGIYFLSNTDRCYEPRRMQRVFSKYLEQAGVSHRGIHCTRHTFATRWVEMGLDIKTLSEILGHTSIRVTMDKYVHISEKTKRENINKIKPLL